MTKKYPESTRPVPLFEALEERRLLAGEPWGAFPRLTGQDQAVAQYPAVNGAGVSVAVIDTGVDYMHPNLGGGFGPGRKVVAGWDFVDDDADPMDTDGHGTGVAGVIAASSFVFQGARYQGVAPEVKLIALRTEPGTFGWSKLAPKLEAALQWVIAHREQYNIVAVNMSIGVRSGGLDPSATIVTDELAALEQMGVVLVAASGNSANNPVGMVDYTASDPNVLAVGSVNSSDGISAFTRRDQTLDLLAPGESPPTLYYLPAENRHITLAATGTSFATPFVTGAAALLKQIDPTLSSDQILSILVRSGTARFDSLSGLTFPRINIDDAIALAMAERDDEYEPNDARASATPLAFVSDAVTVDGLRLLVGDADYYSFTLETQADVAFAVTTGSGADMPAVDLLDGNGNLVRGLGVSDTFRAGRGTYYLRVNAPAATLDGTYGLSLSVTPVVTPGKNASSNSIAYGADGTLHFAFYDTVSNNLNYASRDRAGEWSGVSVIDPALYAGSYLSLAVDPQGRPGVAYYNASLGDLMYAHWDGSAWQAETVDSRFTTGYYPSLAYDPSGRAAISHYYKNAGDLRVATQNASGGWTIQAVDSAGDAGRFSSIARNPASGRWGVSYESSSTGHFKFAEQLAGGGWKVATVDSSTQTGGGYTSLGFTAQGRGVFSYYDARNADLKLAAFDGARWNVQTVAGKNTVGLYSNLRMHGSGALDVLYYHKGFDRVMRATSGSGKAGTWSLTPVTEVGGRGLSRAVDGNGAETLAYWDGEGLAIVGL